MPKLKVAHLKEQGQDMIIVPLDRNFGQLSEDDKNDQMNEVQGAARSAGLRGTVVPVWQDSAGRMAFLAPKPWHSLFQSLSMQSIQRNLNKTLSW